MSKLAIVGMALVALRVAPQAIADTASASSKQYEAPSLVQAGDVITADLLQSGNHRVRDDVEIDGDFFRFELETNYGLYRVRSLEMLEIRVHETRTLAQAIDEFNKKNVRFADELRGQLRVGADSWVDILTSPVGTATELASQLATNVGQTVIELNQLPAASAEQASLPLAQAAPPPHKRAAASQLDLDVYSSNPKVQEFLDAVARARSAGRVGAGITTVSRTRSRDSGIAGGAVEFKLKSQLRNLTPAELEQLNEQRLATMNVGAKLRRRFLEHPAFSPRHETSITAHLEFLKNVTRRGTLIEAALAAENESDALSYDRMARMLALYHDRITRIRRLKSGGGPPVAITQDKGLVVVLPVDIVYWTEESHSVFAGLAEQARSGDYRRKELIVSGMLTAKARKELQNRNFDIREQFLSNPWGRL